MTGLEIIINCVKYDEICPKYDCICTKYDWICPKLPHLNLCTQAYCCSSPYIFPIIDIFPFKSVIRDL